MIKHYCRFLILLFLGVACRQTTVDPASQVVVSSFLPYTSAAGVGSMSQLAIDASDNLYFSDYYGNRVWKVTSEGKLSVFAGNGKNGLRDGVGEETQFSNPKGLAFDQQGNLYVSQALAIRKITPQGVVSTLYGAGIGGIPVHYNNGDTTKYPYLENSFLFISSTALAFDKQGNLFVTQADNHARILKITPNNMISVFFGEPFYNQLQATVSYPTLNEPNGLVFDSQGNLLITDASLFSGLIRVSPTGIGTYFSSQGFKTAPIIGTTLAPFLPNSGGGSSTNGAVFDKQGNLYVCNNNYIEKVTPSGQVVTIAGNGKHSISGEPADNGLSNQVRLFDANSPVLDSKGDMFFIEKNGIRKLVLPK